MKHGISLVLSSRKVVLCAALFAAITCQAQFATLTLSNTPNPVVVGGALTYRIDVGNRTTNDFATNMVVTSFLQSNVVVNSITVTNGTFGLTNYVITWLPQNIPTNTTSTAFITVTPLTVGTTTNRTTLSWPGYENTSRNTTTVIDAGGPDLVITVINAPDPVAAGLPVTYDIMLRNQGTAVATDVILTSSLPASATAIVVDATNGTHQVNGTVATWSASALAAGGVMHVSITATPTLAGLFTNTFNAVANETDTLPANNINVRAVTTVQPLASLLSFNVSAFPRPVVAGGILTLRFSVTNSGTGPSGALTISNLLPPSLILNREATTNPAVSLTNGFLLCSLPPLAPHSSVGVDVVTTPVSVLTVTNIGWLLEAGSALPSGMFGFMPITVVPAFPTQPMQRARSGHTATLLKDGRVLLAGGAGNSNLLAEIYNPKSDVMSGATNMTIARSGHTASLLSDGRVLITGGTTVTGVVASTEIYDPSNNVFAVGASLPSPRSGHVALMLTNGTVMIVGGTTVPATEVVLFNPQTEVFEDGGHLAVPRGGVTAAVMGDGRVLIVGGDTNSASSAEVYDPAAKSSALAGSLLFYHPSLSVTALPDGSAVVIGGTNAEVFLSASGTFTNGGRMLVEHRFPEVCLLPNGQVMVSGGLGRTYDYFIDTPSVEIYNPATAQFGAAHPMTEARHGHRALVLPDGRVFISGGWSGHTLKSTEIYTLILDVDNDGMDDNWELAHNLSPGDRSDAIGDLDHDGHTNLQEYLTGTDPLDPTSIMRIATVELAAGTVRIDFTTAPGKRYAVEWGASVEAGNWTILADNISGTGGLKRVEDHPPAGSTGRVYRVRLIP